MPASMNDILGRMTDLEHQDVDLHFLGMLYGSHGTGKTTLAMWLAQNLLSDDEARILYLDSAEGWVSLKNTPSLMHNADRIQFKNYHDLPFLADLIAKGKHPKFKNVEVVVLDEWDSMSDDVLDNVARDRAGTLDGEPTPEIEAFKDYKPMGDLMRKALKDFQKAGVHVILVVHDNARKDHRNVSITEPSLSPKYKKSVMELLHVVGHTTSEIKGTAGNPEYVRQIQCQPTGLVEAKTRIGALTKTVKMSHEDFVYAVADWVADSSAMAEDLASPEVIDPDLLPDELPTDGIPVADNPDDAPVFVEAG